jgi:hypothetical protein
LLRTACGVTGCFDPIGAHSEGTSGTHLPAAVIAHGTASRALQPVPPLGRRPRRSSAPAARAGASPGQPPQPAAAQVVVANWVAHQIHREGVYESELERIGNLYFLRDEAPHRWGAFVR